MVDFQCKRRYDWEDFLHIMRLLRSPGGCPWDAEQTHQSIRRNFLEETYEAWTPWTGTTRWTCARSWGTF